MSAIVLTDVTAAVVNVPIEIRRTEIITIAQVGITKVQIAIEGEITTPRRRLHTIGIAADSFTFRCNP